MPNRDYAVRSKTKNSGNKLLIVIIIFLLLALSGLGLWILQEKSPVSQVPATQPKLPAKQALPSKPEEIYSYIRDLETREVPVDKNSKFAQLSKEQEKQLQQKQEAERQRLAQQLTQVQPTEPAMSESTSAPVEKQPDSALTAEQIAENKVKEQKVAEERRKQAELKKQQAQQEMEKQREVEKAKVVSAKVVATTKPASEAPKPQGKYGLQCGVFKNKANAENMQARLAMAGYNARINTSAEWNRVVIGPLGDRSAASAAQSNARSVAECLIIGM